MRSGVPVICRAGTSMAEFAEGACVLCDTGESEELASHLQRLMESQEERDVWAEQGRVQAEKFSWKRCADELVSKSDLACACLRRVILRVFARQLEMFNDMFACNGDTGTSCVLSKFASR